MTLMLIALIHFFALNGPGYAQPIFSPHPPTAAVANLPNIIEDPANETKDIGERTFCVCEFSNTPDFPVWRINKTSYFFTDLPSIFKVNETGLLFNASAALHNTRFECYFIFCTQLGGCYEIQSSPGYLTLRQQVPFQNRTQSDCKPKIVEILVTEDAQDSETVGIAWIPNCDRPYTIEVATCKTPQSSPSILCRVDSSSSTSVDINIGNCSGESLRDIQPLLFRVVQETSGSSSYLYTRRVNITDTMQAEVGGTVTIPCPSGVCNLHYKICIKGQYNECFNLSKLPPGHRMCPPDNLCIDISDQSLNGSVYTLLCPQISVPDCDIDSAVDILTYNFRLIINGTDSDDGSCGQLSKGQCVGVFTTIGILVLAVLIITVWVYYRKRCTGTMTHTHAND